MPTLLKVNRGRLTDSLGCNKTPSQSWTLIILVLFTIISANGCKESRTSHEASPLVIDQRLPRTSGGVFIPRNGGFEGLIGQSHVFFNQLEGGVMSLVNREWSEVESIAKLDMVFNAKAVDSAHIEIRQSYDKNPRILFLEEGNDRIGLRVLFKLYDAEQHFHGHGMTETWLHGDGQMFITAAAMFENTAAHEAVVEAAIDIDIPDGIINKDLKTVDMTKPNGQIFLTTPDEDRGAPGLSLYWKTGKMEHNTYIFRSSFGMTGAPVYFRWPDYYRQAYTQRTLPDYVFEEGERAPWPPGRGVFVEKVAPSENGVKLHWPIEQNIKNPTASFNSLFRLALVKDTEVAKSLVDAELEDIELTVTGGVIHGNEKGYNDQEGCYEIRKTGSGPLSITLPADPLARMVRVKVIGLTGNGAVTMSLDGKSMVPQLSSDGGIADDPLAPIHDQPEAPANAGLVTIKLLDKPQILTVKEEEGIQFTYQSRDARRNYMIFSTKSGPHWSGLQFSLVDGHARHMRAYGQEKWALTENLLHWFAWMGYTPEQMLDQLRDFEVVKNGPDEVVFKYTSNNANDGAQSVYEVHVPANAQAMQINVRATFTVLEQWPYKSVQFFDVFPFKGVEPEDWWYDQVIFMDSKYQWRTFETLSQTYDGHQDKHSTGPTFQGLYSADRGNMLMLTKSFDPALPTDYVICGNYIDLHSNVTFDNLIEPSFTLEKGYQSVVEYELAIWGDQNVTQDQIIDISKNSLKAGTLVLP